MISVDSEKRYLWNTWGGRESYERLVEASKQGTVYELRVLKDPKTCGGFVNIGQARVRLVSAWAVQPKTENLLPPSPIGYTRRLRVLHFQKEYKTAKNGIAKKEFFLAEPADPETLPGGEYDTVSQRFLREKLRKDKRGKLFFLHKGIRLVLKDTESWTKANAESFIGKDIELIGWIGGKTSIIVEPKYGFERLDANEQPQIFGKEEREMAEVRDKMHGLLNIKDADGNQTKMAAVTILGFESTDLISEVKVGTAYRKMLKNAESAMIKKSPDSSEEVIFCSGIMVNREDYLQAVQQARDLLVELIDKGITSFLPVEEESNLSNDEEEIIENGITDLERTAERSMRRATMKAELEKLSWDELKNNARKRGMKIVGKRNDLEEQILDDIFSA